MDSADIYEGAGGSVNSQTPRCQLQSLTHQQWPPVNRLRDPFTFSPHHAAPAQTPGNLLHAKPSHDRALCLLTFKEKSKTTKISNSFSASPGSGQFSVQMLLLHVGMELRGQEQLA